MSGKLLGLLIVKVNNESWPALIRSGLNNLVRVGNAADRLLVSVALLLVVSVSVTPLGKVTVAVF